MESLISMESRQIGELAGVAVFVVNAYILECTKDLIEIVKRKTRKWDQRTKLNNSLNQKYLLIDHSSV